MSWIPSPSVNVASLASALVLAVVAFLWLSGEPSPPTPNEREPELGDAAPLIPLGAISFAGFTDHRRELAAEPYYSLLDRAKQNDPRSLKAAAEREVAYVQLLDNPDRYRGRILGIRGRARRLLEFPAGPNRHGFKSIYEAWIFTKEAGPNPYVAILAEKPSGIPFGADINEPCEVHGYFLGWWRHRTQDERRTSSPVLLARQLDEVVHHAAAPTLLARSAGAIFLGAGLIAIVVGVAAWRGGKRPKRLAHVDDAPDLLFEESPAGMERSRGR